MGAEDSHSCADGMRPEEVRGMRGLQERHKRSRRGSPADVAGFSTSGIDLSENVPFALPLKESADEDHQAISLLCGNAEQNLTERIIWNSGDGCQSTESVA